MKTKQKKNTLAIILGIILILCISVVGVLICRNTDLSASADTNTNTDSGENVNAPQFDVIDYQGNKVYATYQFVKLNETDCSVRITNKTLATTANIPSEGIIDGKKYVVTEIASNGFMSSTKLKVVKLSHSIKKIGNMAFANCSQLQYVDLFNVEELGNRFVKERAEIGANYAIFGMCIYILDECGAEDSHKYNFLQCAFA